MISKITAYFRGVAAELRRVKWPTYQTVLRNFVAVVIGVALGTAVVYGFDLLFIRLLGLIIK